MVDFHWAYKKKAAQLNKIVEILEDKMIKIPRTGQFFRSKEENYNYIIPNDWKKYVDEKYLIGLSKDWYSYTYSSYNKLYLQSAWDEEQERYAKHREAMERLAEKVRQEQEQNKLDEQYIGQLRQQNENWKTKDWIESHIGKYEDDWFACYEYYWNVIGNKYKVIDWKKNIAIDKEAYDFIEQIDGRFAISGKTFLETGFKNDKGYSAYITDTINFEKELVSFGVYCIEHRFTEEIVYVGSTMRDFDKRWDEHTKNIFSNSHELSVYDLLRNEGAENFRFKVLIDCSKENFANRPVTRSDVESMELALIKVFQPRGNIAGVKCEFKYR